MADYHADKSADLPEDEGKRRLPPLSQWSNAMDELFEEAMRDGLFDNLPGQGKPLKLSKNPYGSDYELAYQLLKDNDFTLPWIAERNAVTRQVEQFRGEIPQVWQRYLAEFQASHSDVVRMSLQLGWHRYLEKLQLQIMELNKRIANANLKQPGRQLEILKLSLKQELRRAGAAEELSRDDKRP